MKSEAGDVSDVPDAIRSVATEIETAIDSDDADEVRRGANRLNELCELLFAAFPRS